MTNNRVIGVKKSNFLATTTVPDGSARFDFTYGGTNYGITFTNLLANLGVTGTLEQDGAAGSTPVLDPQGSVNVIRNLVPGFGIDMAIDAENSIEISTDWTFNQAGITLVDDPSAESPIFRSLIAGDDVTITDAAGVITIALDPSDVKPANEVVVNAITDFPTAVSGVITLEDDTRYVLGAPLSTSNRFIAGDNVEISSGSFLQNTLTYTGSGVMFTAINKNFRICEASINCASGTFIDAQHTVGATYTINLKGLQIVDCTNFGTIADAAGIVLNQISVLNCDTGIVIDGANTLVDIGQVFESSGAGATFTALDFTGSVNTLLTINNLQAISTAANAVGIKGDASNANIAAGSIANVTDCKFVGLFASTLSGITVDDIRWNFTANDGINDTFRDALVSIRGSATNTTISVAGTPVKAAGTWTVGQQSHFTGDTTGRVTYNGEKTIRLPVTAFVSLQPSSGTNKDLRVYIAKNGAVITNTGLKRRTDATNAGVITTGWQIDFSTNDYVEIWVANDTDTVSVNVVDAVFRVN